MKLAILIFIFPMLGWATKECNNIELCFKSYNIMVLDKEVCQKQADLILTGTLKNYSEKLPNNVEQTFEIDIKKIEKGNKSNLKSYAFETGCYIGSDKSALLGSVKREKGNGFRFYLKKSAHEKSGYKIIHYENMN